MHCLGVHLPRLKAPSIIPQLQHSDMFLIFHADKLPETHFLCFYHVGLTTVKLKVSCDHALALECWRLLQVVPVNVSECWQEK